MIGNDGEAEALERIAERLREARGIARLLGERQRRDVSGGGVEHGPILKHCRPVT